MLRRIFRRYLAWMNPRTEELRRKIALYREYLAQGAGPDVAAIYLRQITRLEAELSEIEGDTEKRS